MKMKRFFNALTMLIVISMALAACQPAPAQPAETQKPAEPVATQEPAKTAPITVKIAFFATGPLDEPWSQAMVQAVDRVKKEAPSGLAIEYKWFEKVPIDDYEKFVRDVIDTKEYDIIWLHDASAGTDPVDNLRKQYPEQIFGVSASNYFPVGGNTYFVQMYAHEPSYLCGVIAGMMTKSNILGMVAGFPYASVNHQLNAFMDGAKSVNPNVTFKNSYIESWWDPVKAKETALAQIEAGADLIFSERYGGFEAARDKGKLAFGNQSDIHEMAPETIITSPLVFWDPDVKYVINAWYDHMVKGTAYNAPADKPIFFLMKDGGSDLAPLYQFEQTLPKEVIDKYEAVKKQILDGTLVIPLNLEEVKIE
jgi:basic membrane lipoprotein Med (substrate-binding protein (PBP1-ABC) superfamily)